MHVAKYQDEKYFCLSLRFNDGERYKGLVCRRIESTESTEGHG